MQLLQLRTVVCFKCPAFNNSLIALRLTSVLQSTEQAKPLAQSSHKLHVSSVY